MIRFTLNHLHIWTLLVPPFQIVTNFLLFLCKCSNIYTFFVILDSADRVVLRKKTKILESWGSKFKCNESKKLLPGHLFWV